MSATPLRCPVHPDREGVGICVTCRRIVCADCSTRIDGINHCKGCLDSKIRKAQGGPRGLAGRLFERVVTLAAIAVAFLALTGGYYAVALKAADIGWFGKGYGQNARILAEVSEALREFQRDVGRFPSEEEGLAALLTDEPRAQDGPIAKWDGPYLGEDLPPPEDAPGTKDAYGMAIRYVPAAGRPRPAVLSLGPNRKLETDIRKLKSRGPAQGDDMILWVP